MEFMDVDGLIAKARRQFDSVEPVTQDVLLGDEAVGVRLWPVSGSEWRALTAVHPWREGSLFDQNLGYDLDGVLRKYPKVYLVQGDDVVNVVDRWSDICDVLSAPDLKNLALAVWGLNEYDPQKRLVDAGKASAGARKKKRS